ncbi:MAG: hypothetical protein MUF51_08485, partial [Vicinamibacteria bacterium]|nr:hypothetical protein [Vicinamibacteria bacterium]
DQDDAKSEGYKRGMAGKDSCAGFFQGWTDDKAASNARTDGYITGKRKRSRLAAEKRAKDRK